PCRFGEHDRQRVFVQSARIAERAQPQPEMVEGDAIDVRTEVPERMEVAIADAAPIAELDAELEGRFRFLHQRRFIDIQSLVNAPDRRQRCLTVSDSTDLLGFDQPYR